MIFFVSNIKYSTFVNFEFVIVTFLFRHPNSGESIIELLMTTFLHSLNALMPKRFDLFILTFFEYHKAVRLRFVRVVDVVLSGTGEELLKSEDIKKAYLGG